VECLASQRYPDRPLRFEWEGQMCEVTGVVAETRTPQGFVFKVLDSEQKTFSLFYNETTQVWTVKPWN
jgi:hypothetical protein